MTQPFNSFAAGLPSVGVLAGGEDIVIIKGGVTSIGSPASLATYGSISGALAARRAANIAAYLQGPAIPAPLWVTGTTYAVGNVVSITGGQHILCTAITTGIAGSTMPAYSATVLTGRPFTDGGVTWYGLPIIKAASDATAPTVTTGASAAALGLTETKVVSGSSTVLAAAIAGTFGAVPVNHLTASYMGRYTFANGPSTGSGNATGFATTDGGLSASYVYNHNGSQVEFYITDSKFGFVFSTSTNPVVVEIDGQLVQGNPAPASGSGGWCIAYDYNGSVKRRRVRLANDGPIDLLRGVALSTIGILEPTDSPNDTMLVLGDSIMATVITGGGNGLAGYVGNVVSKLLGITGTINCGVGGSGYISSVANSYTTPQVISNPVNQLLFAAYNPGHVLIGSGFNDSATAWSTVGPAALSTWQAVRALLPNAKITITDGWTEATGPSSNILTQAANLLALFNTWADPNSRFVQTCGPSISTAMIQGTNNVTQALQAGNSCNFVSSDGTHPHGLGAYYLASRLAAAIKTAWNGAY